MENEIQETDSKSEQKKLKEKDEGKLWIDFRRLKHPLNSFFKNEDYVCLDPIDSLDLTLSELWT